MSCLTINTDKQGVRVSWGSVLQSCRIFEWVQRYYTIIIFSYHSARLPMAGINWPTISCHKQHGRQNLILRYSVHRWDRVNEVEIVSVLRITVVRSPRFTWLILRLTGLKYQTEWNKPIVNWLNFNMWLFRVTRIWGALNANFEHIHDANFSDRCSKCSFWCTVDTCSYKETCRWQVIARILE